MVHKSHSTTTYRVFKRNGVLLMQGDEIILCIIAILLIFPSLPLLTKL